MPPPSVSIVKLADATLVSGSEGVIIMIYIKDIICAVSRTQLLQEEIGCKCPRQAKHIYRQFTVIHPRVITAQVTLNDDTAIIHCFTPYPLIIPHKSPPPII